MECVVYGEFGNSIASDWQGKEHVLQVQTAPVRTVSNGSDSDRNLEQF